MSEENVLRAPVVCAEFTNSRGQKVKGRVVGDHSRENEPLLLTKLGQKRTKSGTWFNNIVNATNTNKSVPASFIK